nr:DUF3152 domain-containing protein [uncultured Actinotalea sp.]
MVALAAVLATAGGTGAAALVDAVVVSPAAGEAQDAATVRAAVLDRVGTDVAARAGDTGGAGADAASSADLAPAGPAQPVQVPVPDGLTVDDVAAGLLSRAVPVSAGGELTVVAGSEPAPLPDRIVRTVRVEVEAGLEVDGPLFARLVMDTLNDPRGWPAEGELTFARTDGEADLRVVLASPQKVDQMCAPLRTLSRYSCGRYGHAALNHTNWVQATEEFADLTQYRQYLVNHEVGHLLGRGHEDCGAAGQVAPVMQQQTIRVAPCLPNAWPYPDGA